MLENITRSVAVRLEWMNGTTLPLGAAWEQPVVLGQQREYRFHGGFLGRTGRWALLALFELTRTQTHTHADTYARVK